ncbi:hypothetical protein R1flu_019092 [Riccia fluitans]|uniref:E3 UFM1-protein ligase 1-like N-terminal domain-containing protein n=1 Tax=Riccia fluitans TaxID=41844 RepID=A0ABD1ZL42_9MARC
MGSSYLSHPGYFKMREYFCLPVQSPDSTRTNARSCGNCKVVELPWLVHGSMSSENGVWVARATQQERGLNEDESGGRKRLERRGTSVSRKGSLRRGGRKKSFICSFIWIIGETVELGLVNWLVFKCLTLRGFLKGNFSVTKERLKAEVETEINRLGRASLVDIASAVGVELVHCERVAEQIVAEKPDLTFVQGEIVADSYWDTVAEEVNEALQESGQVVVGELAKRFNVESELLTRVLESRIGKLIQGKLEAGQLYIPAHVFVKEMMPQAEEFLEKGFSSNQS